jgi:hypothetical protein
MQVECKHSFREKFYTFSCTWCIILLVSPNYDSAITTRSTTTRQLRLGHLSTTRPITTPAKYDSVNYDSIYYIYIWLSLNQSENSSESIFNYSLNIRVVIDGVVFDRSRNACMYACHAYNESVTFTYNKYHCAWLSFCQHFYFKIFNSADRMIVDWNVSEH